MNNRLQVQESKQQHVQNIITILQNNELSKLNNKYLNLQNKLLKLIK